ncbi:hypothetical protein HPB48_002434 [Haemaphysalis longicornis]|uniref:Uncharacterized protein n=1 Tax=Haemaphysalis longicornis TaxID=44386 RepID=A0A9J6FAN9_HAELO|nr:hypothetical protein HPB48_002434 [Haemaphysalis longicornis]
MAIRLGEKTSRSLNIITDSKRASDRCPSFGGHANLYHSTWECPKPPTQLPIPSPFPSGWEAALSSSALDDERGLIDRARRIAAANGALD